ncbi:PREDICTED: espin-like [Amphimedon queenslandica]|uniref:G domain-containing protein n=1 Tax=Amphimedon queenslandica TaxID=400682 RepID=A0AAN0JGS7_AMPQE|nr:PREDICTED: espin-like [Amphimedon queenslandica]|eukprot:XP_019856240.1 PREDICTED: espin-like [Amphimedon queenslandica]
MSLEDKCWDAFRNRDHKEAVRLLPLVKEPKKIKGLYIVWDNISLLHWSSRHGWLDITKDLITKYHCDPQERDSGGQNCLHWASQGSHVDVMRYLIDECHCDPMDTTESGYNVLHYVTFNRSLDAIKYLINHHHCDPMATNNRGETAIHCAARHIDSVKYLIKECHCDPMTTNNDGETVLHKAAGISNSPDVIKYLINECNCDPMALDKKGWTPLHNAARWGHSEAIECLLSTGKCDPLAKDNQGKTPLQLAKEAKQRGGTTTLPIFKKFGDIKSSHPIDSYVNVLLVGNPGAGKSTLSNVINETATGSIVLGSFRNVGGVVPCTAVSHVDETFTNPFERRRKKEGLKEIIKHLKNVLTLLAILVLLVCLV